MLLISYPPIINMKCAFWSPRPNLFGGVLSLLFSGLLVALSTVDKSDRRLKLIYHFYLLRRLRMHGTLPPLPHATS
jgi:hypothetical protein